MQSGVGVHHAPPVPRRRPGSGLSDTHQDARWREGEGEQKSNSEASAKGETHRTLEGRRAVSTGPAVVKGRRVNRLAPSPISRRVRCRLACTHSSECVRVAAMTRPPGSPLSSRFPALALALALAAVLWSAVAVRVVVAAPEGEKPNLAHTLFDNLPSRIIYFDDSPVSPHSSSASRAGSRYRLAVPAVGWWWGPAASDPGLGTGDPWSEHVCERDRTPQAPGTETCEPRRIRADRPGGEIPTQSRHDD